MSDLLRLAGVARPLLRLVGRNRWATGITLVLGIGALLTGGLPSLAAFLGGILALAVLVGAGAAAVVVVAAAARWAGSSYRAGRAVRVRVRRPALRGGAPDGYRGVDAVHGGDPDRSAGGAPGDELGAVLSWEDPAEGRGLVRYQRDRYRSYDDTHGVL